MAQTPSQSVLIVGSGIVGLCLATILRARGYAVTVIAREPLTATTSAIAAGMIAPALEAMGDPEPQVSYARLKQAQTAWLDLFKLWPQQVRDMVSAAQAQNRSFFVSDIVEVAVVEARLRVTDASYFRLSAAEVRQIGLNPETQAVFRLDGDWLVEASVLVSALRSGLVANGVTFLKGEAVGGGARHVVLAGGERLTANHVVIAAGYGAHALATDVPSLRHLWPIKGHLLDIERRGEAGVVRSAQGYLATFGSHAKFGASMQAGQGDLEIEPAVVADLVRRGEAMDVAITAAVPRVGIRASTPDGWPLIGRDAVSGVWLAVGMRRNGFVLAPLAARALADGLDGLTLDESLRAYDPNRFDAG